MRFLRVLVLLSLLFWIPSNLLGAPQAEPRPYETVHGLRIFEETGYAMREPLAGFWNNNGGLPIFGVPIQAATTGPAQGMRQTFERGRLEEHPGNPRAYQVQLGLLGKELLQAQGRDWRRESEGETMDGPCLSFDETNRSVCGPFLTYWRSHGLDFGTPGISHAESLALFGLPLTVPQKETNSSGDTVLTQWFERARFEWHPNNPPAYQVLLGRLGAEQVGEAAPPQPLKWQQPESVEQGHTFAIVLNQAGIIHVDGSAGTWPMVWGQLPDGRWKGLGGINVLAVPGPLQITIAAERQDGTIFYGQQQLTIRDAGYPAERIILPPSVNQRITDNPAEVEAERQAVNAIWPQVSPEQLWSGEFQLPAEGQITSSFGTRRAYNDGPYTSYHEGVDIANIENTPIRAAARGRVVFAQNDLIVRGGAVIIDHGQGVHTGYWHMNGVLVRVGQLVEAGHPIGLMGSKGFSTAPHVHWDVRIGALNVDPLQWNTTDWATP